MTTKQAIEILMNHAIHDCQNTPTDKERRKDVREALRTVWRQITGKEAKEGEIEALV